jgi:hypothetical protein
MRRKLVALCIAIGLLAFFVLVPVVSLVPSDKIGEFDGGTRQAMSVDYTNMTITYWGDVTPFPCHPTPGGCPYAVMNSSAPVYLPVPTYGSLSYYFFDFGALAFQNGYTVVQCTINSTANPYCYISVPCLDNNTPWPNVHSSCF